MPLLRARPPSPRTRAWARSPHPPKSAPRPQGGRFERGEGGLCRSPAGPAGSSGTAQLAPPCPQPAALSVPPSAASRPPFGALRAASCPRCGPGRAQSPAPRPWGRLRRRGRSRRSRRPCARRLRRSLRRLRRVRAAASHRAARLCRSARRRALCARRCSLRSPSCSYPLRGQGRPPKSPRRGD